MNAIFFLIDQILGFYLFIVFIWVIFSWLVTFGVIPTHSPAIIAILNFLHRMTEPVLGRIRQFLPPIGGMDLSPLVLIFGLHFLRVLILQDIAPMFR